MYVSVCVCVCVCVRVRVRPRANMHVQHVRLVRKRCARVRREAAGDEAALQRELDREIENLWPRERFSSSVNAAKRAFINRIAGGKSLLCGADGRDGDRDDLGTS